MKSKMYIFFVSETEYKELQAACPGDFPFTYSQFVVRVDKGIKEMSDTVTAVKVYANVKEFVAWCVEAKVNPTNTSRAQYAMVIGSTKEFH